MGAKQTTVLRIENVATERVIVQIDWGNHSIDTRELDPMCQVDLSGQPHATTLQASVEYPASKGRLEFQLFSGDLRNQSVNVRVAMMRGKGIATVNGQQRGQYSTAFRGHGLTPHEDVDRLPHPPPSPLRPKPVLVHINPRILSAAAGAPMVLPQLPPLLTADAVQSKYAFDFETEVQLLSDEGFAVNGRGDSGQRGDGERVPSPVPNAAWRASGSGAWG
eukprot:m.16622 g.16622  ORF g.16622 m.16622 type:complete len:220 (-) comp3405_c0_seq1:107-766(-)